MRKRRPTRRPSFNVLQGQLLFTEEGEDAFTVDCLLAPSRAAPASPVTFIVRFGEDRRSAGAAIHLLEAWARAGTPIEVRVVHARGGTEVEFATDSARVVLEPEQVARMGY